MQPNDRSEFLADLDATQESRVRRKLMLGHYTAWQIKVVEHWLEQRAADRAEERANHQLSIVRGTAFWTKARAVWTVVGVVIAAIFQFWFHR